MRRSGTIAVVLVGLCFPLACGGSGAGGGADGVGGLNIGGTTSGGSGGAGGSGATSGSGGSGATSGSGGSGGSCNCSSTSKCCTSATGSKKCVSASSVSYGCGGPSCDPCPSAPNATTACISGDCGFTCKSGYADCDGDASNGCETQTTTDVANCGGCGNACTATAATPVCSASKCTFTCATGTADCNSQAADGCEVDIQTSVEHCGACGTKCDGACNAGKCQPVKQPTLATVAAGLTLPTADTGAPCGLVVDATTAYFAAQSSIMAVAKAGGTPTTLASGSPTTTVALDSTHVYFSTSAGVQRALKTGGSPTILTTQTASCIALDSTHVYFTTAAGLFKLSQSATPSTETPVQLASAAGSNALSVNATDVFWIAAGDTAAPDRILKIGTSGGSATQLYSASSIWGFAADATAVFAAETFTLRRVPKDGSSTTSVTGLQSPTGTGKPKGVAVDGTTAYVPSHDGTSWAIVSAPVAGGTATKLINGQGRVGSMAVDGTHLYWLDMDGGALRRCEK